MARNKLSVDRDELQTTINAVEKKTKFDSLSAMFAAVAETKWGKKIGITPSVVLLRYQEYGLESKTRPGKRGRKPGNAAPKEPAAPRVTELDGPGRGRKQCAECKRYVGAKSSVCVCGSAFEKRDTLPLPDRKPDAFTSKPAATRNDSAPTIYDIRTFGFQKVLIPAGECPVKLAGTDRVTVIAWMNKVCEWYESRRQLIGFEGLAYYARMQFYDFDTPEYERVRDILREQWTGEDGTEGNWKRVGG